MAIVDIGLVMVVGRTTTMALLGSHGVHVSWCVEPVPDDSVGNDSTFTMHLPLLARTYACRFTIINARMVMTKL